MKTEVRIENYSRLVQILFESANKSELQNSISHFDKELKSFPGIKTYIDLNPAESISEATTILKTSVQKLIIQNNIKSENSLMQKHIFKVLDKFGVDYSDSYLNGLKKSLQIPDAINRIINFSNIEPKPTNYTLQIGDITNTYSDLESLLAKNQNIFRNFDAKATEDKLKESGNVLKFVRGDGLQNVVLRKEPKVLEKKRFNIVENEPKKGKGMSM